MSIIKAYLESDDITEIYGISIDDFREVKTLEELFEQEWYKDEEYEEVREDIESFLEGRMGGAAWWDYSEYYVHGSPYYKDIVELRHVKPKVDFVKLKKELPQKMYEEYVKLYHSAGLYNWFENREYMGGYWVELEDGQLVYARCETNGGDGSLPQMLVQLSIWKKVKMSIY